jgi:hypothetical protein
VFLPDVLESGSPFASESGKINKPSRGSCALANREAEAGAIAESLTRGVGRQPSETLRKTTKPAASILLSSAFSALSFNSSRIGLIKCDKPVRPAVRAGRGPLVAGNQTTA